jgi:hypothetical protein
VKPLIHRYFATMTGAPIRPKNPSACRPGLVQ